MTTEVVTKGSMLKDKTVILDETFHKPGVSRAIKGSQMKTEADPDWVRGSKKILKSRNYRAAVRVASLFRKWLVRKSLPAKWLRRGMHLIPVTALQEVYDQMDKAQAAYNKYAAAFLDEYEEKKVEAKERLKELFSEGDYPPVEALRTRFWVERHLIEMNQPSSGKLGNVISDLERAKTQERWAQAEAEVITTLRESFRDLINHLTEQLAMKADGKKNQLHEGSVNKILDWVKLFQRRNVLDDSELEQLATQAADILKGKAVKAIRKDVGLRTTIKDQMVDVKKSLDQLLVAAPKRKIVFDD